MSKEDKENNENNESVFHGNALNVTAFLGGTVFAALILMIEVKDSLPHHNMLISGTAIVSVLFVISTIGMTHVASNKKLRDTIFAKSMERLANAGFFGLMLILPFLVFQLTEIGGIGVSIVEAAIIAVFLISRLKSK